MVAEARDLLLLYRVKDRAALVTYEALSRRYKYVPIIHEQHTTTTTTTRGYLGLNGPDLEVQSRSKV